MHEVVDDDFLCMKIEAFKYLCIKEGDYKTSTDTDDNSNNNGLMGK